MSTKTRTAADPDGASLARRIARAKAQVAEGTKRPASAALPAGPPPLGMAAPGKDRHIEVTVSKQATASMREIGGSEYELWDNSLLHRTMMAAPPISGSDGKPLENYSAGLAGLGLRAFAPKDPVEAMIASQAVALHFAALECSRRAMLPQQSADVASRLRRDAANSARAMVEMTEALERRRGKGPQVVRVERVVVNDGGQAMVGHVSAGAPLPAPAPAPQPIGRGEMAMSAPDAAPVVTADVGEGER